MPRFEGKVVLVTGAASGIGRATALRIAREGGALFLTDVALDGLQESAKLVAELGAPVESTVCDVSDEGQVEDAVAACAARFGRLDALCNVAGILYFEHFDQIPLERWRRVLAVNLDGTFLMCRAALPHLLQTQGAIVNVGSTAGLMGLAYGAAYGASKGAVHALTRALAVEYAARGLRCNSVCPGSIVTRMLRPDLPKDIDLKLLMRANSLQGSRGPEVVADLIAFLASSEAEHINGEEIRVDGAALA